MINRIIEWSLRFPGLVALLFVAIVGWGVHEYRTMPVDAFPDISPVMVPIFAEADGLAPEEVERLVAYPLESGMNGLPGVTQVKSTSAFGLAVVYVYFEESMDIYFCRQLVAERLADARNDLPAGIEPPVLGPLSTGLGQIFLYYLTIDDTADTGGKPPDVYLRELNDWVVKYQLQTVPGVTDILSIGGHVLQYQIRVDPDALRRYDLAMTDVVAAVQANNRNVGGQYLVLGSEEHLVRGIGLVEGLDDLRGIPVKTADGRTVAIRDVADVEFGSEIRRGVVSRNGTQEVVSGMVLKLYGQNTSQVIDRLYKKVESVQRGLPKGVELVPYYEQAELVQKATGTVKRALWQGAAFVAVVLLLFLGNVRAALLVSLALPFCTLVAVLGMRLLGISANLMSLGGIAVGIGMLVDGAIVVVDNIHRLLSVPENRGRPRGEVVLESCREVGRPIVFAILIVIVSFLPIFTLSGTEGKMFSPLAATISLALVGSILAAIVLIPALSLFVLRPGRAGDTAMVRLLKRIYAPLLRASLAHAWLVVILAILAFGASAFALTRLGTEFIPNLEEGSIMITVTMAPSISLEKATATIMALERRIAEFPEVEETVSRIGRPEAGSHPHPVNFAEIHIELTPATQGAGHRRKEQLVAALATALGDYPGVQLNFTQPIQNAFDELLSGIKAQLAIKLYGDDLGVLQAKAGEIQAAIEGVPGLVDLAVEQSFGQPQVQVIADRAACAQWGVSVEDILGMVELAVGGQVIDSIYLNTRRFGIHLRYGEEHRDDPEALRRMLVTARDGRRVPLGQVARIESLVGPVQINRENSQRRWIVQGNVRGRDLGGVFHDIRERIDARVSLPPGTFVEYGGQFENQQRATRTLSVIVPIVIASIFVMLWMTFGRCRHAGIVIVNVPLALIGGVLGLLLTRQHLSVPASVGFVALFGIAMQDAVVLVTDFNDLRREGHSVRDAILKGGLIRFRPVLITTLTTLFGLLPLLASTGTGAEIQRPLAAVVTFGLASSTLLTLFVIPAVYWLFERHTGELA